MDFSFVWKEFHLVCKQLKNFLALFQNFNASLTVSLTTSLWSHKVLSLNLILKKRKQIKTLTVDIFL